MHRNLVNGLLIGLIFSSSITPIATAQDLASEDGEARKFELQARRYHQLLMRRPRRGTGFDLVFRLYLDAGRLDELVKYYEEEIVQSPKNPAPRIITGLLHERRGRFDDALKAFDSASQLIPNDFYVHYYKATILQRLHRHKEAIAAFDEAIKHQPPKAELLDVLKRLGRLHTRNGEAEKAQAVWKKLTTQFPGDRLALEELAELLVEEEQFEEAIKQYQQLETLAKGNKFQQLSARVEIGQIQVRQGKLKTAISTFETCLADLRTSSWQAKDIRRRIEQIFERSDDLTGLAQYYQEWLKKRPQDLEVRLQLARVLSQSGKRDEAIKQYEEALEVAPSHLGMRRALITEYVAADRIDDAIDETEQLIKLRKDDIESMLLLGDLYLQRKDSTDQRSQAEDEALQAWTKIALIREADPLLALKVAEKCRATVGIGSRLGTGQPKTHYANLRDSKLAKAALKYYNLAVERAPENVSVEYLEYLAEFQFSVGDEDAAFASWKSIAAPPNDNSTNLRRLAEIYMRAEQLGAATETVELALKKNDASFDIVELATQLRLKQSQFDQALKHVDALEALADTPFYEERSLQVRVEVLAAGGRLELAARELDGKIADKTTTRDYFLAAMIATAQQRWTKALAYLQQAIDDAPKDTRLFRYKAQVHQQGGDLEGASAQFRQLAKIEPGKRTLHLKEVVSLELEMGRLAKAREAAEEIVRYAPENPEALQLLADVAFRAGKNEEGIRAMQRSVRVDPRNADSRLALARKLADLNRIDEAIEHTWRALELADTLDSKMNVVAMLAEKYAIAGETKRLLERLQQMRQSDEDIHQTTLLLAQVHIYAEDFVAARKSLNELLAKRPNDLLVLNSLVQLSQRLGDTEQAIEYQKQIFSVSKDTAAQEQLARLYQLAGQDERAREIWLQLAQRPSDDKTALRTADRSMRNKEYVNVIALCQPKWNKRSDDWRFGYRLVLAFWLNKQFDEAEKVANDVARLAPHKALKNEVDKTQRPNASRFRPTYPPIAMRLQNARQFKRILAMAGSNNFPYSNLQFNELADAQMLCALVQHEAATRNNKEKQFEEELLKTSKTNVNALRQLAWIQMAAMRTDVLESTVKRWTEKSPDDAEARLMRITMPFYLGGLQQVTPKQLEEFEREFQWFEANRTDLLPFVSMGYMQLLSQAGDKERARKVAKRIIDQATKINDLASLSTLFSRDSTLR